MQIDHSKIIFQHLYIHDLFMRQYIKIQNISNINKYEINLIEFLNIWTNVVVAYEFENSEDVLSKAFCHYILLFSSTSNELVDIPSKSLKNREYVTLDSIMVLPVSIFKVILKIIDNVIAYLLR